MLFKTLKRQETESFPIVYEDIWQYMDSLASVNNDMEHIEFTSEKLWVNLVMYL